MLRRLATFQTALGCMVIAAGAATVAARQDPRAILLDPGQVNASTAGTSWWLANQSVVVTWDRTKGVRVASVYDRLGGRTATKPGDAFTIALADGTAVRSTDCRLRGAPAVEDVPARPGDTGRVAGRRITATFACPDETRLVSWQAELASGADMARQVATVTRGTGTATTLDVGCQTDPSKAAPSPRTVSVLAGPYLQNPGPTSVTVMWITDGPAAGWVEYGTDARTASRAVPTEDGLVTAGGRIHAVTVSGLRPGTAYQYRIVTRPITAYGPYKVDYGDIVRGDVRTFRTLAVEPRPFSFVVMNDLHENVDILRSHARRAQEQPFDLVFFNGDSLSHLESEAQMIERNLAPASQAFAGSVPFLLVRGNHETRGRSARDLKAHLSLPGGRYYYAFTHAGVRFIVLDTGEDKEDSHWAYSGLTDFDAYRQAEAEWLKEEVQTAEFKNAKFRIVVAHMPFFGNERTRVSGVGPTSCRERFGQILNDAGIDLHIAGHTHRVDWVDPAAGANRFPIVVGGSSSPGANTLTRVSVAADRLDITQTTDDGKVVSTHSIAARR